MRTTYMILIMSGMLLRTFSYWGYTWHDRFTGARKKFYFTQKM